MPHFYLHIHNGIGFVADKEGSAFPGLDAARGQAIASIRSILSDEVKLSGLIDLGGRIDIVDENGTVTPVRFDEAVEVRRAD